MHSYQGETEAPRFPSPAVNFHARNQEWTSGAVDLGVPGTLGSSNKDVPRLPPAVWRPDLRPPDCNTASPTNSRRSGRTRGGGSGTQQDSAGARAGPSAAPLRLVPPPLFLPECLLAARRETGELCRNSIGRSRCRSAVGSLAIGGAAAGGLNRSPGRGGFCPSATLGRAAALRGRSARGAGPGQAGLGWADRNGALEPGLPQAVGVRCKAERRVGPWLGSGCAVRPAPGRLWPRVERPARSRGQRRRLELGVGDRCPWRSRARCCRET